MTEQKQRITRLLSEIGACWAVTMEKCILPSDPLEDQITGKATYHIHPDRSELRSEYIQRFTNLKALEAWIREQRPATWWTPAARADWQRTTITLPGAWISALKHRDGNLQAAIERLVKNELEEETYEQLAV